MLYELKANSKKNITCVKINKIAKVSKSDMKRLPLSLLSALVLPISVSAESFYLYFSTYESKDRTNKIESSPTLHASPFSSLTRCEAAGRKIFNEIYKPIKFFDGRWICVEK